MGYPLTIRNQTEQIERAYRVVWFGKGTISVPFFFDLANVSTPHSTPIVVRKTKALAESRDTNTPKKAKFREK